MQTVQSPEQVGLNLILDEVTGALRSVDPAALAEAASLIEQADRVFVFGQGRSGIAQRALGMRLMHLGLSVHVVGETTAPAIGPGDVLMAASGSGTTESVVRAAERAVAAGAVVITVSTAVDSPLARLAACTIRIDAAVKTDHGGSSSAQYAGSLFEQAVLLVGDALFHALWQRSGAPAEELWTRHANIE